MTDQPELERVRPREYQTSRVVSVTIIISCTIIALACIAAATIVVSAFFMNPPW